MDLSPNWLTWRLRGTSGHTLEAGHTDARHPPVVDHVMVRDVEDESVALNTPGSLDRRGCLLPVQTLPTRLHAQNPGAR